MSRPGTVFFEGGVYHVSNRPARGQRGFDEEVETPRFKGIFRGIARRDELTVFTRRLIGTHYHPAVRTGTGPLQRPLGSLQQRVTRGVNAHRRVHAPLWQGRHRAKLVSEEQYLDQLLVYIHLNPVAAGIVHDPAEYRWSGHREILGREQVAPGKDIPGVTRHRPLQLDDAATSLKC